MLRLIVTLLLGILAHQTFADESEAIVGGTQAVPGEFPHQVSLRVNGQHVCGGSIINPKTILTAAHCVINLVSPPYSNFQIVTGTVDNRVGNVYAVKSATIHPNYKEGAEYSWINDIAVITLRSPIIYNASQRPIRLASSPPQSGIRCLLSGWGRTSATGRASQMLLKINTGLIDNGSCMNSLGIQIYSTQVCAFSRRGIGACQGDSGGPLICNGEQYGVVSWSSPCAVGTPDVYTSVYHHRNFIERAMAS